MQDFLSSNEDVTLVARNGLLLKYKSVARRRLAKAGVPPEERKQQLEVEMERFATAVNSSSLSQDYFNSSFRSVAPSTLNQTARSICYREERSVANTTSRSVFQDEEEDEVEIVIDSPSPRMAVSNTPPAQSHLFQAASHLSEAVSPPSQGAESSPHSPSPLQSQFIPQAASSSHQLVPPNISLASHSFLGCPAPSQPDVGNLFDAYDNNNSLVDTSANNPEDDFPRIEHHHEVPRFCSTPNPYSASGPNVAPNEPPRFASTSNPYFEPEPNPEHTPTVNSTTPTFEELVHLVKNFKKLDSSNQQNLLAHIRRLERENPSLVTKIHQELNATSMQ